MVRRGLLALLPLNVSPPTITREPLSSRATRSTIPTPTPLLGGVPILQKFGQRDVLADWGAGHAAWRPGGATRASGTSQTTPSGGSDTAVEHGWLCHGSGSASTPPRLPVSVPP